MTVTGHQDSNAYKRYNVRRDDVQRAALDQLHPYLTRQRNTTPETAVSPPKSARKKHA